MPRRFAAHAAITAALGLALYGATALPALADTSAPVAGTQACTDAVNSTTVVKHDSKALANALDAQRIADNVRDQLNAAVPGAATTAVKDPLTAAIGSYDAGSSLAADIKAQVRVVTKADGAVTTAQNNLNADVKNQTNLLCTGSTASTSTTGATGSTSSTTPAPSTSPAVVPHTRSVAFLDGEIDALSCGSSNADLQTIDRQIAARQAAHQTTDEVNSRLNAKIASLNCTGTSAVTPQAAAQAAKDCGCDTTTTTESQAPQSSTVITYKTVVPTQSDGSVATTSGTQVTDVPAGSASTGSV